MQRARGWGAGGWRAIGCGIYWIKCPRAGGNVGPRSKTVHWFLWGFGQNLLLLEMSKMLETHKIQKEKKQVKDQLEKCLLKHPNGGSTGSTADVTANIQ